VSALRIAATIVRLIRPIAPHGGLWLTSSSGAGKWAPFKGNES